MIRVVILSILLMGAPAHGALIDRVVAVVNNDIVTLSELQDLTKVQLAQVNAIVDPVARAKQRNSILKRGLADLIGKKLIAQEATKRQLKVEDRQIDAHLQRVQRQQRWTDEQLKMYLASQGLSESEFREEIRGQLLQQRVVGMVLGARIQVSDGDLQNYYKERRTQLSSAFDVEAAHVVLRVTTGATVAEETEVQRRAQSIYDRAVAGEDFAELAKQTSEGPAAKQGGYLGFLSRGAIDPRLEEALFSLKPGGIDGPLRSPFGYHVVKLISRRSLPPKPFEAVKDQLRSELHRKKMDAELGQWIDELRSKAFIEERL